MYIPVRYRTYDKEYKRIMASCPKCGSGKGLIKSRNKTVITIMFIPFFQITNMAFLRCSACAECFPVEKKTLAGIRDAQDALRAMQAYRERQREKQLALLAKYSVGFSSKNQRVAALLAFFLTVYSAPFFYLGRHFLGAICLGLLLLGTFTRQIWIGMIPFVAGIVYGYLILMGRVKDWDGKYVVNERQREAFSRDLKPTERGGTGT